MTIETGTRLPALRLRGVRKHYGGTVAVAGVDLDLYPGEVHALVGENGAGKSTLLGIAAGRVGPTAGTVEAGDLVSPGLTPHRARAAGICAVYQELTIVPALSTQANVFLGAEMSTSGMLNEPAMRARYLELCDEVGVAALPDVPAGRLSVADQQMLEILRAVAIDARVLLFDEPTAALAATERQAFFRLVARLRASGVAIAFVSHNLDEILEHSDVVTVFRDGRKIAMRDAREWTRKTLVDAMLGLAPDAPPNATRSLEDAMLGGASVQATREGGAKRPRGHEGRDLLVIRGLRTAKNQTGLDLTVREGEILGIAGLVGSGRTSILRALAGLDRSATGIIEVEGTAHDLPWGVREARRAGISLLPEDRKGQGLSLPMAAIDNIALGEHGRAQRRGLVRDAVLRSLATEAMKPLSFDHRRLPHPAWTLSGGNQQKLMVGRWILSDHRVLLADEPMRGVDVRVRADIMTALRGFADAGRAVVLVSSELEEVVALSDRVAVLRRGALVDLVDRRSGSMSVESLLHTAFYTEQS